MKTIKFLKLISLLAVLLFITSCVEDDDFDTPNVIVTDPGLTANATFNNMVSRYLQAVSDGDQIAEIRLDESPIIIEGYVISSDRSGNFFEELIIQNTTDDSSTAADPRLGFRVEINVRSLSDTYEVGRKVYIKMNGLAIGEAHGTYVIGKANGNDIGQMEEFEYRDFVIRGTEVATLTPKVLAIGDLTGADENTLVQFSDMQFHRNEIALSYAGEPSDNFDGFRVLESCVDGGTISLQTSTFADFKSLQVSQNQGAIKGVFTRDFGDDINVLVINSTNDISFNNTERCDPDILECTGPTSSAFTVFEEDFQTITNEAQLDPLGWTNVNVNGGGERFEDSSFSGNRYMKISAFGTGENPLEAWLVTPTINLDSTTEEELTFDISSNFETGKVLSVFITDNFTGDPTTTEWTILDANVPTGGGGFGSFVSSTINISCLDGDVHVAFKYLGAAGGAETRYHIDNVKVTGQN
jgi:hypothetical protein